MDCSPRRRFRQTGWRQFRRNFRLGRSDRRRETVFGQNCWRRCRRCWRCRSRGRWRWWWWQRGRRGSWRQNNGASWWCGRLRVAKVDLLGLFRSEAVEIWLRLYRGRGNEPDVGDGPRWNNDLLIFSGECRRLGN